MANNKKDGHNRNKKAKKKRNYINRWVIIITIWTFLLTIVVSLISDSLMRGLNLFLACVTLVILITLGVFSDVIGIAVAAGNEKSFHAMASDGVKEAKYAVRLIRYAPAVSNFCNDVIGDICGILSGAAGAIIVVKIMSLYEIRKATILSILISAVVASLTVGGKAIGKEIGINKSKEIIGLAAKFLYKIDSKLGINLVPELKGKR